MPTPIGPVQIAVKVTNGREGEYVKVTNLTSGGTIRAKLNSAKEGAVNSADSGFTWNIGDVIQATISGRINQTIQQTLATTASSRKFELDGSADTATLPIDL